MKIATTIGDPSGIGPEVVVKSIKYFLENEEYGIFGSPKTLRREKLQTDFRKCS